MWIAETIDLDNHDSVVKFMKNQSDKIKKLEKENERLKGEVAHYKLILMSLEEEAKRISSIRSYKNE